MYFLLTIFMIPGSHSLQSFGVEQQPNVQSPVATIDLQLSANHSYAEIANQSDAEVYNQSVSLFTVNENNEMSSCAAECYNLQTNIRTEPPESDSETCLKNKNDIEWETVSEDSDDNSVNNDGDTECNDNNDDNTDSKDNISQSYDISLSQCMQMTSQSMQQVKNSLEMFQSAFVGKKYSSEALHLRRASSLNNSRQPVSSRNNSKQRILPLNNSGPRVSSLNFTRQKMSSLNNSRNSHNLQCLASHGQSNNGYLSPALVITPITGTPVPLRGKLKVSLRGKQKACHVQLLQNDCTAEDKLCTQNYISKKDCNFSHNKNFVYDRQKVHDTNIIVGAIASNSADEAAQCSYLLADEAAQCSYISADEAAHSSNFSNIDSCIKVTVDDQCCQNDNQLHDFRTAKVCNDKTHSITNTNCDISTSQNSVKHSEVQKAENTRLLRNITNTIQLSVKSNKKTVKKTTKSCKKSSNKKNKFKSQNKVVKHCLSMYDSEKSIIDLSINQASYCKIVLTPVSASHYCNNLTDEMNRLSLQVFKLYLH